VANTRDLLGVLHIREREESLLTLSGGSEDSFSDGEPYSEEDHVERISTPREYFRQLELLEESVYQHSAIFFQHSSLSEWQFDMPFPEYEILEDADPGMFDIFRDARTEGQLQEIEGFWLYLCHLRNVIFSVYLNLMRLKIRGFCGNHISLIVVDPNRPDQVAKLLPLLHSDVRRLAIAFNEEFRAELMGLSKECGDFLDLLGLSSRHDRIMSLNQRTLEATRRYGFVIASYTVLNRPSAAESLATYKPLYYKSFSLIFFSL
jgi:hypothetical protein